MQLAVTGTRENRWRALAYLFRVVLRRSTLSFADQQVIHRRPMTCIDLLLPCCVCLAHQYLVFFPCMLRHHRLPCRL